MDKNLHLEQLHGHARNYRFGEFDRCFKALESDMPAPALAEAFLMRAQIKLYASDGTFAADMERGRQQAAPLQYPCLGESWLPDSPDRLIIISREPEDFRRFAQALTGAGEVLARWYGAVGAGMARQMQSEILYFQGLWDEALTLAQLQCTQSGDSPTAALSALYVQYRCHLALGQVEDAGQCMVDMAQLANAHPECHNQYRVARTVANLTTGWSGDTPRYQSADAERELPVFDDRLKAIQKGISRLSKKEEAIVAYAQSHYDNACTLRQHYMEAFHAVYWFDIGDLQQAEAYFMKAYAVSRDTGLVMPFVEYGKQIAPLLHYAGEKGWDCPHEWLERMLAMVLGYEESLNAYRD